MTNEDKELVLKDTKKFVGEYKNIYVTVNIKPTDDIVDMVDFGHKLAQNLKLKKCTMIDTFEIYGNCTD